VLTAWLLAFAASLLAVAAWYCMLLLLWPVAGINRACSSRL
jgi:hypothetical protein